MDNPVEFFIKTLLTEIIVGVIPLVIGILYGTEIGKIACVVFFLLGIGFAVIQFKNDKCAFFEYGIPSILASVSATLLMAGNSLGGYLVAASVLYCCIWWIIDEISNIFG